MLKMIRCDKFMENGSVRPPIMFNSGLNTVIGGETGSNSIGKSTFLMILDFVFGGDDYVFKSTDVQEAIKVHTIEFMFEFDGKKYYYSRSTGDHTVVNICDENFNVLKTVSNTRYMEMLAEKYGIVMPGLTLRGALGRFFRVYGRETLNENHPLNSFLKETDKSAIEGLLKLCDKYEAVEELSDGVDRAKDEVATIKKAAKYQYISAVPNKTTYKENLKRIEELTQEAQVLAQQSSQGLLDMDSMQAGHLAELKHQLSNFRRQRTRLISQKKGIEADRDFTKHTFQKDYDALLQFFPGCDLQRLESIEQFHRSLSTVLKKEFKENVDSIQAMIDLATQQITILETQIAEVGNTPNVSEAILARYASVQKELQILQEANENFDKAEELKERAKALTEKLNALILEVILVLQQEINSMMAELNHSIYNGRKTAPTLTIKDASHYSFFTPRDSGTGSKYKGLVVFDLAMLHMTVLPVLAHDSLLLKQIEDSALEKILELYTHTTKQVFITLDKEGSYTERAQEIMRSTEILRLYPGGGELFGRSWNEPTQNTK